MASPLARDPSVLGDSEDHLLARFFLPLTAGSDAARVANHLSRIDCPSGELDRQCRAFRLHRDDEGHRRICVPADPVALLHLRDSLNRRRRFDEIRPVPEGACFAPRVEMDTTPVAIAQRADLIPFVYNYCDQWCGR